MFSTPNKMTKLSLIFIVAIMVIGVLITDSKASAAYLTDKGGQPSSGQVGGGSKSGNGSDTTPNQRKGSDDNSSDGGSRRGMASKGNSAPQAGSISITLNPSLPACLSGNDQGVQRFAWTINFASTATHYRYVVTDPSGNTVLGPSVVSINSSYAGQYSPVTGSDQWQISNDAAIGAYYISIELYSAEVGNDPETSVNARFDVCADPDPTATPTAEPTGVPVITPQPTKQSTGVPVITPQPTKQATGVPQVRLTPTKVATGVPQLRMTPTKIATGVPQPRFTPGKSTMTPVLGTPVALRNTPTRVPRETATAIAPAPPAAATDTPVAPAPPTVATATSTANAQPTVVADVPSLPSDNQPSSNASSGSNAPTAAPTSTPFSETEGLGATRPPRLPNTGAATNPDTVLALIFVATAMIILGLAVMKQAKASRVQE